MCFIDYRIGTASQSKLEETEYKVLLECVNRLSTIVKILVQMRMKYSNVAIEG